MTFFDYWNGHPIMGSVFMVGMLLFAVRTFLQVVSIIAYAVFVRDLLKQGIAISELERREDKTGTYAKGSGRVDN